MHECEYRQYLADLIFAENIALVLVLRSSLLPNSTRLIPAEKINIPFSKPTNLVTLATLKIIKNGFNCNIGVQSSRRKKSTFGGTRADHLELVHSCTAALEIATIYFDLGPGDEVIMPSFTFLNCNAVALRGATPVFVDICCEDLNVEPDAIAEAITARTKAVLVVHYAGCKADLSSIQENKSQRLNFD